MVLSLLMAVAIFGFFIALTCFLSTDNLIILYNFSAEKETESRQLLVSNVYASLTKNHLK